MIPPFESAFNRSYTLMRSNFSKQGCHREHLMKMQTIFHKEERSMEHMLCSAQRNHYIPNAHNLSYSYFHAPKQNTMYISHSKNIYVVLCCYVRLCPKGPTPKWIEEQSDLILFPSSWAASSSIQLYVNNCANYMTDGWCFSDSDDCEEIWELNRTTTKCTFFLCSIQHALGGISGSSGLCCMWLFLGFEK